MSLRTGAKKGAAALLGRLGILEPALDTYQTLRRLDLATLRRNARFRKPWGRTEPIPIPGPTRLVSVAGTADIAWFLDSGARGADCVRAALERHGTRLEDAGPFLDFGCGCGRVIRHFMDQPSERIVGADMNRRAIRWCEKRLPKGTFVVNEATPPLALPDQRFGLVYAFSVFTHLPEPLQRPWLDELARVLRPGGLLLMSTHGQSYREDLDAESRARFDAGSLVERGSVGAGSNYIGVYHPDTWLPRHLPPTLEIVEHTPEGALGNPTQDLWVVARRT